MPVYRVRGPDGAIHRVEGPENADPSVITALVAQSITRPDVGPQRKYGIGETLSLGTERGLRRLGSTFGDIIPALGASALGFDDYAKAQLEEAAQSEAAIASEIPAEFQSYKDVGGVGDAVKFAAQVGSEQLGNLATALVPGVGLGGLAVRGAVGTAAQLAAKKAAGQLAGAYLGSYALNAPEVFQNIYQETGELAPGAAALFGTASAALDSFLPASLMRTVPASLKVGIVERLLARSGMDKGLLRSVTSNVLKNTTGEAVTEAAQEGISIAAERFINDNPEVFGEAEWDRIMESAVQGGVGGGVFGISGGVAERASKGAQDSQRLSDIRELRTARDAATRSRGEEAAREKEIAEYQQAGPQLGLPGVEPMPYASSLVTPTSEVEEPKVRGKAPTQAEMFTPQGALTPVAEKMESKDSKAVATQNKQAEIVARQVAQRQAAAARVEAQKVKNLQKPSSQQSLALGEPVPLAKVVRPEDAPATTDGQLDMFVGEGVKPVAQPVPSSVLPTDKGALRALFPGATPALSIFNENGPLWGRDLANPKIAAQVKTDLETVGQKYTGKNLKAVETFLARPEFQAAPVLPTPTTASPEGTSGQVKTVKAKAQKPKLGQKTPPTGATGAPVAAAVTPADANAAQMTFTPASAGGKRSVSRARPISPEAEEKANALANTEFRKPTKEAPQTPEESAAMFFRAYDPASAIRVMVAEGTPGYTETQTVPTKDNARSATRWVMANMDVGDVITKHAEDFKTTLSVAKATSDRRTKRSSVKEALAASDKTELDTTKKLDRELKKDAYKKDIPSKVSKVDRELIKADVKRGDAIIAATTAETAGGRATRDPNKAKTQDALEGQKKFFELSGGKVTQLPPSGPEQIRQIIKGPKYQGKSFDATMRALVEKGNIDAVLDAIIKTAKPEIAQVLRKVKSLGLKTKIALSRRPTKYRDENLDPSPEEAAKVQAGIEGKTAVEAANFIANNATDPAHRTIAKAVAQRLRELVKTGSEVKLQVLHVGDSVPSRFNRVGVRGTFYSEGNIVHIKGADITGSVGTSYEVVLHELVHAVTANLIQLGSLPSTNDTVLRENTARLYAVRDAIITHFNKRVAESKRGRVTLTTFEEAVFARDNNALDNVDEILTWALTNPDAQAYMESIPYQGKNGWTAFVQAIRELLGLPASSDTALAEILSISEGYLGKSAARVATLTARASTVAPLPENSSGSYNPATDTITLDAESGVNEHIFIHEVLHAALSKVFANPNLKITKDMQKFFMQIKDRMGDSYGGLNLDEFASELVSNPEFQALLKTIKAPRSGSLWDRIMQAIAEFFGFSKGQSAYEAGLKFVSDALDVSEGVEANPVDKLFYGPGKLNDLKSAVSGAAKGTKTQLRDALSSEKDLGFKVKILGAVSLNDMETMFGTELPIKKLETAVETKSGAIDKGIDRVSNNVKQIQLAERKYPNIIASMNKMAIAARRAGVDLIDPAFTPTASQQVEYDKLKNIYNNVLNKEVREVYGIIRKDLDGFLKQFTDYITSVLPASAATRLLKDFANLHGVTGYVPFLRHGEFWVEYIDPVTGERTPMGRESPAAVDEVIAEVKKQHPQMKDDDFKRYVNIQNLSAPKDMPAASFVSDLVAALRANDVDPSIVDSVYQQYHSMFPANSIMKQFSKAKMLPGMDEDIVRSYSDVAVKWVHKIANMEYNPKILEALTAVKQAAGKDGKYGADMNIQAVAKSINAQQDSFLNLTYSPLARGLTTGSYYLHILGSVASAAVNLTGLPFFVYPLLGGRFGFPSALTAMLNAGTVGGNDWSKGKYKTLYESLDNRGLLKHTMAREALERGKSSGKDFSGVVTKVIDILSVPFSASERYMRGVTAIAAYELALKGGPNQKAMSPAEAIEFAAKTIKDTHTAGMSEVAPAYFKNDFGRVILTFKKIAFQQTFVIARAFHQALIASDLPPEAKSIARKQLLGIFGMSGAFLGASGLPLYGMFSTLARMLEALIPDDDDEPYDPNMQLRGLTGDFLYEGLIAKLLNIDISKRAALANDVLFRDDPQSIKDMGYVKTVMFNLAGPMGGYAANTERALGNIADGNVERGLETMLPTFFANGMKGIRYMLDGAETLDGEPIDEDVNAWNGFTQMFGFAPADLAETQEMRSAAKNYENKILARKQKILDRYNMAYAAGDMAMAREAMADARAFRRSYPDLMASDTLERSRRGREASAEEMLSGLRFTKSLRADIERRFNLGGGE